MVKIEIKELKGEEIGPAIDLAFYAFFPTPGSVDKIKEKIQYFTEDTSYVLFEDEKPVSAIVCKPILQNVRGVIKPMCGIQNVATSPEARRKGYAKKLMFKAFEHMKYHKQVFSTLYPFKEAYYEKMGYISFPQIRTAEFTPTSLESLLFKEISGTVERMQIDEGYEIYRTFLHEMRKKLHGMGVKADTELKRVKDEGQFWLAVAKDNEEVLGILTYKITGFWKEIKVRDFYYKNSQGKYLLLKWFAAHSDQVKEVHIPIRPDEYPETWVYDAFWGTKGKIKSRDWVPCPMGRVTIVEKLNGLNVGSGKISIKIKDDYCDWNNGSFSFESKEGILHVEKTNGYDCELTIQGFSAIIYGCYDLDDFQFKEWGILSQEVKDKIRKLFPHAYPYLHADF